MPITFWAKVFFLEPHFAFGAWCWAGLGLGWGGWWGLGWGVGEAGAGLGWAGLGWAGLGWAGLGWPAGRLGSGRVARLGLGLGYPETEIGLIENEAEIGLFEHGKVCIHRKNELPHVQHQQAISIYFFLEGLGFRV